MSVVRSAREDLELSIRLVAARMLSTTLGSAVMSCVADDSNTRPT